MGLQRAPVERDGGILSPAFVLLWVYSTVTSLAWAALLVAVPLYVKGPLQGGDVAVGLVVTAATVVAASLSPLLGWFGDRRGRRLLLVCGPAWFALFVGMFAFARTPEALLVLRAAAAVGDAAFTVGALTLANDLAPAMRRGEAYSIFSLSTWVGTGLGPVCADVLLHSHSFNAVWLMCAALALAGAALGALLPARRPPGGSRTRSGIGICVPALFPGLVLAFEMVGFVTLFVFGPLFAREMGLASGGTVLLVASVVLVAIRVFGRTLPDRLGPFWGAITGLFFVVFGLFFAAIVGHPAALFVGGACVGVGHALAYPALLLLAVRRAPESERSSALGTFKALESVGFAAAGAGLGLIAAAGGYALVFVAGASSALIGALLLAGRRRLVHH